MAMHTLDTRFARFEEDKGGEVVYKEYQKGEPVDLSPDELEQFAAGVAHPAESGHAHHGKAVYRSTVAKEDGEKEKAAKADAADKADKADKDKKNAIAAAIASASTTPQTTT